MKYLYALSLILIIAGFNTSCKKAADNYELLPDTTNYHVKSGSITIGGKFATTYTAPQDDIVVRLGNNDVSVRATKSDQNYNSLSLTFNRATNGSFSGNFNAAQQIGINSLYISTNTSSNIKDYNNASTGILLNGDFACSFKAESDPIPFTLTGSVNLQLNRK